MQTHELKVDEEHSHVRLDIYLSKTLPEVPSRSFIKRLIDAGEVTVNDHQAKAHYKVSAGDVVVVEIPDLKGDDHIEAEDIALDIFYEDEYLIIINKPVGMLVHPVKGIRTGTLVNALLHHCRTLSNINTELRPGIVHRLDRETSGVMVAAKDNKTHAVLAKQFEKHLVKKQYLALVEGEIEFDEGVVDVSLARHNKHHDKKMVAFDDSAKEAKTFYRVIRRHKKKTLVALYPQTGRTHQLRVHMVHLGHPILGDDKYGKKNSFPRLALHAQALGFKHPRKNHYIEFSVHPPKEFFKL